MPAPPQPARSSLTPPLLAAGPRRGLVKRQRIGASDCTRSGRAVVGIHQQVLRADPLGLFGIPLH